jgi:hypothetical protein
MKTKKDVFEIDFIGEQTSLTKEEEKVLSDYFKQKKENFKLTERKKTVRQSKTVTK